jgi:hypothetical protein
MMLSRSAIQSKDLGLSLVSGDHRVEIKYEADGRACAIQTTGRIYPDSRRIVSPIRRQSVT